MVSDSALKISFKKQSPDEFCVVSKKKTFLEKAIIKIFSLFQL